MTKEAGAEFSLVNKMNKDLHDTIKNSIIGGPSIIYQRETVQGKTKIRGGKTCEKVLGFDANALYLWVIGKDMPVGPYVRRRAANDFKPEYTDHWMNYQRLHEGKHIQDKDKRIGRFPVECYDIVTKIVYQFQGCYHHGYSFWLTEKVRDKRWLETKDEKFERTQKTTKTLRNKGFEVVELWECELSQFYKSHPRIYDLINSARPAFCQKHRGKVIESQMLNGVTSGQLFGMVE